MKQIQLTQDKITLVDDDIFDQIGNLKWFAVKTKHTFYAARKVGLGKRKQTTLYLHHVVLGFPQAGFVADHINGDGLNNQRSNLRIVTHEQNNQNRIHGPGLRDKRSTSTTSKYVGVHWHKWSKKWQAKIMINGIDKHIGYFSSEKEAFMAYQSFRVLLPDFKVGK